MVENNQKTDRIEVENGRVDIFQPTYRKTKVKKIMEYLYLNQKPVTYKEICNDTGLTYKEAKWIVCFLNGYNQVTKKIEFVGLTKAKNPKRKMYLSLNDSQRKKMEFLLKKYGILNYD